MRICIVGGGKVGYYLSKTLLEHGHVPIVLETNNNTCKRLANDFDMAVIHGDGTNPEVLALAELDKCQALVAVTGQDENNLIACQLAKQVYKVRRTVARVNNPKNTDVLKKLGVDIAVSSTDHIARLIEREVETEHISQLLSLDGGTTSLTQVVIPDSFPYSGMTLAELPVPENVVVISVTRGDEFYIPRGNTTIKIKDKVTILAKNEAFPSLGKAWKLRSDK